nr:hypothetical protein Iba_chr02fCG9820 [Ipomoea batatas]
MSFEVIFTNGRYDKAQEVEGLWNEETIMARPKSSKKLMAKLYNVAFLLGRIAKFAVRDNGNGVCTSGLQHVAIRDHDFCEELRQTTKIRAPQAETHARQVSAYYLRGLFPLGADFRSSPLKQRDKGMNFRQGFPFNEDNSPAILLSNRAL